MGFVPCLVPVQSLHRKFPEKFSLQGFNGQHCINEVQERNVDCMGKSNVCGVCEYWDREDKRNGKCWCSLHDETTIFTAATGTCSSQYSLISPIPDHSKAFQMCMVRVQLEKTKDKLAEDLTGIVEVMKPIDSIHIARGLMASLRRHGNTRMAEVWRDQRGILKRHRTGRKGFRWFIVMKVMGNSLEMVVYSNNLNECVNWISSYLEERGLLKSITKHGIDKVKDFMTEDSTPPMAYLIQSQRIKREQINGFQVTRQGILAFIHEALKDKEQFIEEVEEQDNE